MQSSFSWKRFWGPRGEAINLSDSGFLYDPESEYGRFANPHLVTLDQIADKPCLALLGEPGIGKSWTIEAERERQEQSPTSSGERNMWLNLRSFGSEDRLWGALFGSELFQEWRTADYVLNLFLDSLDECLLRIDNVATLIADSLPAEPWSRLRIRIACRSAPWPGILERGLIKLYGEDAFQAYELAPLRRRDVVQALEQSEINDTDGFVGKVEALGATSFAIKPVTLNFLIKTHQRDGKLPTNQIDLYTRGCRILCEESNESRTSSGRATLDVNQRFIIACRIAAVTQLCNRFAVSTETESSMLPEDLSVSDLSGSEQIEGTPLQISSGAVREVLDTGLFSSIGLGRSCWAHQTYAEFLAAEYCTLRRMSLAQLQSVLFHPEGGAQHLIPQLDETAGWMSVMNPQLLDVVASTDPEALLGSAAASLSDSEKERIVQSLLDQSESGRLLSFHWNLRAMYPKLCHPRLDSQLKPYITDSKWKEGTRHVAIDMVRACELQALDSVLAKIALDTVAPRALRISAAAAVASIGSRENRALLRPLALAPSDDDSNDELKGAALSGLWPELMTPDELFSSLTRPKDRYLHGAYSSFLYGLADKIRTDDLPFALEWFAKQGQRDIGPIDSLMDGIIGRAIDEMDANGVLPRLADAIMSRVRLHDTILSHHKNQQSIEELGRDDRRRQALLAELLPKISENEIFFLHHAGVRLIPETDLGWLLARLDTEGSDVAAQTEIKLIRFGLNTSDPEQMQSLWRACQRHPRLDEEYGHLFFVRLDSEDVRILRESQRYGEVVKETLLDPPPDARVRKDLLAFENGNIPSWVDLTFDLCLRPTSRTWEGHDNPDLTQSPGWQAADEELRQRIQHAARRYVSDGDPENEKWFGTNEIRFSAISGFQALVLLLRVSPDEFNTLPNQVWLRWIPIILQYPHNGALELKSKLLRDAYIRTPDEVVVRLMQRIRFDDAGIGYLIGDKDLEACWDDRLADAVLTEVRKQQLKPAVAGALLELLLRHESIGSRELAQSLVSTPPPDGDPDRSRALAMMQAMVIGAKDGAWQNVWPVIREYSEFGRSLVESLSYGRGGTANWLSKLSEDQIGEFYVWMMSNYPPSQSDHRGAGAMSPRQAAVMVRDQALEILKRRGTFAAAEAIRKAMESLPQYSWLSLHLEEAELLARAATWRPVTPRQLLSLASNDQRRLIESPRDLTSVVLECLERLQLKLKGENPAAKDLWNSDAGEFWPKDEEDLSDYVHRHLDGDIQDRGIVVNREVQIRRGIGEGTGQKTDIHVDAIVHGAEPGTYARLSLIIEAKGNWNQKLFQSMETQLRDRYLKDNRCRNGIYVVGWFSSPRWRDRDPRKKQCPTMTITQVKEALSEQARTLSESGFQLESYVLDIPMT